MDEQVIARDVGVEIRDPVKDPEAEHDLRVPDDIAAWAIALDYEFTEGIGKDLRARAKKAFDYYNGEQWDPATRQRLEQLDNPRPVLTFNEIGPKINAVIGEERRNREDWVAKPREGSDEAQARIRTALLKYVREINALQADESRVFEEGVIGGFGGLGVDLVPDPEGGAPLLRIGYRPWRELRWDWTSRRRDFTDAQWMGLSVMADPKKLSELFPEWSARIDGEYAALASDPQTEEVDIGERVGVTRYRDGLMRRTLYNQRDGRIRALQFYWRTTRIREFVTFQSADGLVEREVPEDNAQVRAIVDRAVAEGRARGRVTREAAIRGALIVGRQTLAQWWSPFSGTDAFGTPYFPIFVWFASDTNGYIMGLVEPMMSPQDEVNKRWSMTVENYLRQGRSGGTYEDGAFVNESEVKAKWGSPGYWAKVAQGAHAQEKFKEHVAKPTDTALMTLFQMAEQAMERVSSIDRATVGLLSREESGVAIRSRALQSAIVRIKAFDNFRHMQWQVGRFVNANLHLSFPEQRTLRLMMPTGETQSVTINELRRTQEGAVIVANDMRSGRMFDVVMDMTPSNATFREMQAQNLANVIGQVGPAMQQNPFLLPIFAKLVAALMRMLDGIPNAEDLIRTFDAAIQQMLLRFGMGGPEGMPGGGGAPPPGAGPPAPPAPAAGFPPGAPFVPAAMTTPPPGAPVGIGNLMGGR